MSKSRFSTRTISTMAVLISIEIVFSRFLSFNTWNMKIGFGFVPVVIAAILYGPIEAGITAALADFVGAILFPVGTYFPGFTLTAFLIGVVFGLFLHRGQRWAGILISVGINQISLSLFLNTLWISILYGSPYVPLLATRAVQSLIHAVLQCATIPLLAKLLRRTGINKESGRPAENSEN